MIIHKLEIGSSVFIEIHLSNKGVFMIYKKYLSISALIILLIVLIISYFYIAGYIPNTETYYQRYMENAFGKTLNYFLEMHWQNSHVYGAFTHEEYEHLNLHRRLESRTFMDNNQKSLEFLRRKVASPTKFGDDEEDEAACALDILKEINTAESWQIITSFSNHPDEVVREWVKEYLKDKPTEFDEFSERGIHK